MIEIIVLISLWKKVGRMVEDRGHENGRTYQWLLIVMWFGGQISMSFVYSLAMEMSGREPLVYAAYLLGLLGGGLGLLLLFSIIHGLPRRETPKDAHYQPRRRSAL